MRTLVTLALVLASAPVNGADSIEPRLAPCLACHGAKGQSAVPEVPSLGGQPEFYLTVQVLMFRDRLRAVDLMNQILQGFSDNDLRATAKVLAQLPPPQPAAGLADADRMEQGRTLAEQNRCNFCHQAGYTGERNVPRLAGQREDYLVKAMREFKGGTRRGYDAAMADVLYQVSDEQILDLAYYLARLR